MQDMVHSARYDMDDLWQRYLDQASTGSDKMRDGDIQDLIKERETYKDQREGRIRARKWNDHRYFLSEGIAQPEYQRGEEPKGVDPAAGRATNMMAALLPSAGPAFDPPIQPMADFLADVRMDMVTPMRRPAALPRGFPNPRNLCYRNSVLTALLNTPRFLSFLYTHGRYIRTYLNCPDVNHHLLTRLYHLALAYWERGGVHPMSSVTSAGFGRNQRPAPPPITLRDQRFGGSSAADGRDSYQKMLSLFWRACKYDLQGHPMDGTLNIAEGERHHLDDYADNSTERFTTKSWRQLCQMNSDTFFDGSNNNNARPVVDLTNDQQDAAEFLNWLVEMSATQLYASPRRYSASRASDCFDSMFRTYITNRYLCTMCKRPVRLRSKTVERCPSITINLTTADGPSPPGKPPRRIRGDDGFKKLLHEYFNDNVEGMTCNRCGQKPKLLRRMRRMQTAPEILNIHLSRTGYDSKIMSQYKTNDTLEAPQFLDVSRYLERHIFTPGTKVVYRLAAVVSHKGDTAQSGHYVSYVRDERKAPDRAAEPVIEAEEVERIMKESLDRKAHVDKKIRELADTVRRENEILKNLGRTSQLNDERRQKNSDRFMAIEEGDSDWIRLNDDRATIPGIPFTRIINTSRDPAYTPQHQDWFDPVLLIYEKYVEKYVIDTEKGLRVYQVPMNVPHSDFQGPEQDKNDNVSVAQAQTLFTETIDNDVPVPQRGTPRRVTRIPPGVFRGVRQRYDYVDRNGDAQGDGSTVAATATTAVPAGQPSTVAVATTATNAASAAPAAPGAPVTATVTAPANAASAATTAAPPVNAPGDGGAGDGGNSGSIPLAGGNDDRPLEKRTAPEEQPPKKKRRLWGMFG